MGNGRGFSLVEVLVSMLLVLTGLLALGHTLGKSIQANYRTSQEAHAIAYAQQKVEFLKTVPFAHSDLSTGTHTDTPASGFTRTWTVTTSGNEKAIRLTLTRLVPSQTQPVSVVLALQRIQ
jgi:prepilin-type N-terminal cleavage/methylation domain-containing protein